MTHGGALFCLAVVAVVYAWPLIANMTAAIPGEASDHDVATMVWNVGWVQRALNGQAELLRSDAVLVPFGADLRLHTYGLLQGLLAYPFIGVLGVVGAYNLTLLATLFLNGGAAYFLVHRVVRHKVAALIASSWLMLSAPLLSQLAVGRPAFASIWIVCGALVALMSLLDDPKAWKAITLGLLLLAAVLADFQLVLFTAIWVVLYGAYRISCGRLATLDRARLLTLGLAGLIAAVPFVLVYYPALAAAQPPDVPHPSFDDMAVYSYRLRDYVSAEVVPYAYGWEFLTAALVATALWRWHGPYRFWLAAAGAFLMLALGPYLQPWRIPLPFGELSSLWPPMAQFRTPSRLTMPALIGLAVVAGLVLAGLLPRIRWRPIVLVLAVLGIGARVVYAMEHDPLRVQSYPDYATYRRIAVEPGDFSLLEVPFGVRSGLDRIGAGGEVLQYYQHVHGKRLINGMIARLPASVFGFYRGHPTLALLAGEPPDAGEDELDRDFAEVLRWSRARYVLVHRSLLAAGQATDIEEFLGRQPELARLGLDRDLVVYRVREAP